MSYDWNNGLLNRLSIGMRTFISKIIFNDTVKYQKLPNNTYFLGDCAAELQRIYTLFGIKVLGEDDDLSWLVELPDG